MRESGEGGEVAETGRARVMERIISSMPPSLRLLGKRPEGLTHGRRRDRMS